MSDIIKWTPEMLVRFKRAYAKALKGDIGAFEFEGHNFLPEYAKYLIEYLDSVFGGKNAKTNTQ